MTKQKDVFYTTNENLMCDPLPWLGAFKCWSQSHWHCNGTQTYRRTRTQPLIVKDAPWVWCSVANGCWIAKVCLFPWAALTRQKANITWKPAVMFTALHILTKRHFNLVLSSQECWRDPSTLESFVCCKFAQQEGTLSEKNRLWLIP